MREGVSEGDEQRGRKRQYFREKREGGRDGRWEGADGGVKTEGSLQLPCAGELTTDASWRPSSGRPCIPEARIWLCGNSSCSAVRTPVINKAKIIIALPETI